MACLWAAALVAGCSHSSALDKERAGELQGRLTLTGSSTVAPLISDIAKRFEQQHPRVRIDVQTGGSSRGIADARRGTADIGMASRALKPAESDLAAHTIARDGVTIILHRDNPVAKLSDEQIVGIYTGRIVDWSEVGGPQAPITVANKAEGRATLEVFLKYFQLKSRDIQASIVIGDNQQAIRTVAGDPHAIAYVSIGTAEFEFSRGVPIRLLAVGGIEPTTSSVGDGVFPMSRPLNLVTQGEVSPLAQAFIEFARSDAVHDLVKDHSFVPATH